jgi:acetylornithine aminotransferase
MNQQTRNTLMPTYTRLNKAFVRGEGCYLYDSEGKAYLDALSGIGVVSLGHANPKLAEIISQQAKTLIHTSNVYQIPVQQALADKLASVAGMENCFFSNSGAEANEAALKIARLHARTKDIDQPCIIVMENSFHGRTLATLSATDSRKVQAGFEPLVPGFIRVSFNDLNAIKELATKNKNVVAVLLEPVQGEGGIHIADKSYLEALYQLCQEQDWLFMLDEVQSGNGRTGKYFAFQHTSITPDVVSTAKGLGNGLPIGACLSNGKAANLMQAGNHGSTYGGNQLVCAAALEVVNTISDSKFLEQVNKKSELFKNLLNEQLLPLDLVAGIRIKGLMIGIELTQDCPQIVEQALNAGLLINVTSGNVIRLLPPLVIAEQDIEKVIRILKTLISKL